MTESNMTESNMTESKTLTKITCDALSDKKAEDIRIIDISDISVLADYFIIANGTNINQIQAMVDAVNEAMTKSGHPAKQIEGNRHSSWVLLDFGDIIVHLFSREDRLFYDLERIWRDGKVIERDAL